MTAPNWFGWVDTNSKMRNEKKLAKHYAAEVGNDISDFDAMVLAMALDACQTDPEHKRDGLEAKRQADEIAADNEWLGEARMPFDEYMATVYPQEREKRAEGWREWKKQHPGTRMTISGGEVLELDAHLESRYDEQYEEDMPF